MLRGCHFYIKRTTKNSAKGFFFGRKDVFALMALGLVELCDAWQLAAQLCTSNVVPSHQQEASSCCSPESNQI